MAKLIKLDGKIYSTRTRSFVKGITWEIISFFITTLVVYLVYDNFIFSLKFSFVLSLIKLLFYFLHERIWKRIVWGKC